MKKNILVILLSAAFLTGCELDLGFIKFGEKENKEPEKQQKQEENNQNQNQEGGNDNGGNQQDGGEQTQNSTVVFDFANGMTTTSGSKGGVSFTSAKADGNNDPAYNSNSSELRLYVGNTLTISANSSISSIEFVANTCTHEKADGGLTATPGSLTEKSDGYSWTGSANSVTFTCDPGRQVHINSFTVVLG